MSVQMCFEQNCTFPEIHIKQVIHSEETEYVIKEKMRIEEVKSKIRCLQFWLSSWTVASMGWHKEMKRTHPYIRGRAEDEKKVGRI